MAKPLKILDCTLRDGGYYNNWDFEPVVVEAYLRAVGLAKIDYVELGLRSFPKIGFLGAFAYTTEEYLSSLTLPEGPVFGVMIDAKTILESDLSSAEAVKCLFAPAAESKLGLVRVAAHFHEVGECFPIVECLKALGYTVGLNLMQAGGKPSTVISDMAKIISDWGCVDVLYFADSLGNMDEQEVQRIVSALRLCWQGELGIHTHDNMGKGLTNSLAAKAEGVSWLDSTVTGMGRGAGNTQTERLLAVIGCSPAYNAAPINDLAIRHFEPLQKIYGWGSNLLYFLGAQNDVHPTYIQNLLSSTRYSTDEIIGAIDYLSSLDGTYSYTGSVLEAALCFSDTEGQVSGSEEVQGLFDGDDVLIIANSEGAQRHSKAIESYIKRLNPKVIAINTTMAVSDELIDYYAVSHNSRFLSESDSYKKLKKPIILPKCRFTEVELNGLKNVQTIDYGLEIVPDTFKPNGEFASIPYDITIAYVLAVLLESQAASINLVGFDGYAQDDIRQQEMLQLLKLYNEADKGPRLRALTLTTYPVDKGSIYEPSL